MVALCTQVDGTDDLNAGATQKLAGDAGVDERLHAPGEREARRPIRAILARERVLVEEVALVLVVDHEGPALGVDVDAVDGTHEVRPGVGGRQSRAAAEAALEQARLEAVQVRGLVLHRARKVLLQLVQTAALGRHVRDERLLVAGAPLKQLVGEVLGEFRVEKLEGAREVLGSYARALHAQRRVIPEERALWVCLRGLGDEALRHGRLHEQAAVGHLEHAVGEGAHLHVGEARVAGVQAETSQREPLVGALEVGLDLGGREHGAPLRKLGLAVARHHDEPPEARVELAGRGAGRHLAARRRGPLAGEVDLDGALVQLGGGDGLELAPLLVVHHLVGVAGDDLGEHDGREGLAGRCVVGAPEQGQVPHRHAHNRRELGTGLGKAVGRLVGTEVLKQALEGAVGLRDGAGLGIHAEVEQGVGRAGSELGRSGWAHELHRAGGALHRHAGTDEDLEALEHGVREHYEALERDGVATQRDAGVADGAARLGHGHEGRLVGHAGKHLLGAGLAGGLLVDPVRGRGRRSGLADHSSTGRALGLGGIRGTGALAGLHALGIVLLLAQAHQLAGSGGQVPLQDLLGGGGHAWRGGAGVLQGLEHALGREDAVAAPCAVPAPGAFGADAAGVEQHEVDKLARGPPAHVGWGRLRVFGPALGELGQARDRRGEADEARAHTRVARLVGHLGTDVNATGMQLWRQLAPARLDVRTHHHDAGGPGVPKTKKMLTGGLASSKRTRRLEERDAA